MAKSDIVVFLPHAKFAPTILVFFRKKKQIYFMNLETLRLQKA